MAVNKSCPIGPLSPNITNVTDILETIVYIAVTWARFLRVKTHATSPPTSVFLEEKEFVEGSQTQPLLEVERISGLKEVVFCNNPSRRSQLLTTRSWDFMGFPENVKRNPTVESNIINWGY
ncbi:hypothetical protein NC653_022714 [Populus alba x Populus x berolinensis]|uniref:Uncharacterized protein n=1 Tax=Populus alba x Populus x berolinensis TaxID=444605 RepID=A0AAD6Q9S5_9ROSI|nr:hypothetical protein NC653_022714 [Populus alba x Populus x berolinensis]